MLPPETAAQGAAVVDRAVEGGIDCLGAEGRRDVGIAEDEGEGFWEGEDGLRGCWCGGWGFRGCTLGLR